MRLSTTHDARKARNDAPVRCYSLGLPDWAMPAAGGSTYGSRARRKYGLVPEALRRMRSHSSGAGR
jgi:hypothetical protein